MKNKKYILILFLMLLVFPISTVLACGNTSKKEKTFFSKDDNHFGKKTSCDNGAKDGDGCSGACYNSSCHSPSTVNISVFNNEFELSNTKNFTLLVKNWSYIQHISKAVYLSIWQPPKIS